MTIAGRERRRENPFDLGAEDFAINGPVPVGNNGTTGPSTHAYGRTQRRALWGSDAAAAINAACAADPTSHAVLSV